ncbi:DoxX family protein [Nocardioides ultimimeridianus]
MEITYWITASLLALVYLAAGAQKSTRTQAKLVEAGMAWAADLPLPMVRFIGVIELLGALGLILPPLLDIAPALGPTAAVGLALVQVGAVATHVMRREPKVLPMNIVLLVLAVVAAVVGFKVWG